MSHDLLRPAKAAPGDRVAVLSPSFAAPAVGPEVHEQALRRLQEVTGLVPVEYPTTRRLDATAVDRAADLNAAFGDPEIRAVLATIGGDDQITVIPHLDPGAGPSRPQAVPGLQRQHQPPELAVEPRRRVVPRRLDAGASRPGPGRRRDPRRVAARRAADRGTARDHRARRVGGRRAAVGGPGRAHVVRRAGAHRALDVGRPRPVGDRPRPGAGASRSSSGSSRPDGSRTTPVCSTAGCCCWRRRRT